MCTFFNSFQHQFGANSEHGCSIWLAHGNRCPVKTTRSQIKPRWMGLVKMTWGGVALTRIDAGCVIDVAVGAQALTPQRMQNTPWFKFRHSFPVSIHYENQFLKVDQLYTVIYLEGWIHCQLLTGSWLFGQLSTTKGKEFTRDPHKISFRMGEPQ